MDNLPIVPSKSRSPLMQVNFDYRWGPNIYHHSIFRVDLGVMTTNRLYTLQNGRTIASSLKSV